VLYYIQKENSFMSRGGKRKGAGRKKLPAYLKRQPCPIKLPQWLIDDIDSRPGSRAGTLENAYMSFYNLKAKELT